MTKPVAFFDIDGTLFRSSLLAELSERLIEDGIFPKATQDEYMDQYIAWRNREGTYADYIGALVESYMRHIKGVHYGEVADLGRLVVAAHAKQVYRYTRDLITDLKQKNYYLVAISQSPKAILDEFCRNYGFDKVYGRMYEIGPTDRFTGEVIDEHLIENKANIVKRVFDNDKFDHNNSVAVGDTEGDISMLEAVGRPICFNPNQKLYDYARQMNWEIVVERKDVIYKL